MSASRRLHDDCSGKVEQQQQHQQQTTEVSNSYQVLQNVDHDTKACTQGLTFDPDNPNILYESTGIYGESEMRVYRDFPSRQKHKDSTIVLNEKYYGEGCAIFHQHEQHGETRVETKRLIQLTWQEQTAFVYQVEEPGNLQLLYQFNYTTTTAQGWGITYNPRNHTLIVTDGTQYLHIWDADTLQEIDRIEVKHQHSDMSSPRPICRVNELEYDESTNTILANVFMTNYILRINPSTGFVLLIYDFEELYTNRLPSSCVLNGIAIRNQTELWLTGKYWPYLYQVELNE